VLHTFEGAERDPHTGSLERVLVHALLRRLLPTGFPREGLAPPEAELLFRARCPPNVRARAAHFELARVSYELPCGAPRTTSHDAFDRLLLPTFSVRVPAPRELPASLRDLRLALGLRTCTRDQETGGPGVSRRRIRFGELFKVGTRRIFPGAPLELHL